MKANLKLVTWIGVPAVLLIIIVFLAKNPSPGDEDAIKIGVIYAGTGPASFAGAPEKRVLELLMNDNNAAQTEGKKIVLEFRDSGGDKNKAIQFLENFSNDDKCLAVIGPTASGESIAVGAKVLELPEVKRMPILSLAASSKIVQDPRNPKATHEWMFKFAQNDDLAARKLVSYIKATSKGGKVFFLSSTDAFGNSGAENFAIQAGEAGLKVEMPLRTFAAELNSPDTVIDGLSEDAESIVIWGSQPGPALLVRRLKEARPNAKIFLSHGNASQDFIDSVRSKGTGAIVVGSRVLMPAESLQESVPRDHVIRQFQKFWTDGTGKPQSHFAGHAYDAFQMLREILNADPKKTPTRTEIKAALETKGPFPGITGEFDFAADNHSGLGIGSFEIYQIKDDKFVPVSPP